MSDAPCASSSLPVEDQPKIQAETKADTVPKVETEAKTEVKKAEVEKKKGEGEKLGGPEEVLTGKMLRLKLEAEDGVMLEVDYDVARVCGLLRRMMEDLGIEADYAHKIEPLTVSTVSGKTLEKIMVYCKEKRNEEYKPKDEKDDPRIQLTQWDNQYMDVSSDELMAILTGANYLDIPGIIDITTQKIANMADGKSVEELREMFELVNDFTQAEEDEIRERFAWVEQ